MNISKRIPQEILAARFIWLMLDYDGTLADFAPTPDDIIPDIDLISLLNSLSKHPKITLGIISGRRLAHIQKLVPISGIWLAGSYGLEIITPQGECVHRSDYNHIRPLIDRLKPAWEKLIKGKDGFYLEDKGWSIAFHARFAEDGVTHQVLSKARELASKSVVESEMKILGGNKFLEFAPVLADKGKTISSLLENAPHDQALPIFIGDDDKDELAFPVVQDHDGLAICVCNPHRITSADYYLSSPQDVRKWLLNLLEALDE